MSTGGPAEAGELALGWSDAETSPGEHAGTSAEGGEAWGPKQRAELEGPPARSPEPRGKPSGQDLARWGAGRGVPVGREGGPVRSTGQKQPAPGGLGEQMPGNISEAPTLSNQDQ